MKKILAAVLLVSATGPAWGATPSSTDGAALYKKNCAACHGANGQGATAPAVAGKSASMVAKAVAAHPPPMEKVELTPDETAAVGRFVSTLKK
jgi:mono/diheme cytochrome c family protein